jgi:hypothetical protein
VTARITQIKSHIVRRTILRASQEGFLTRRVFTNIFLLGLQQYPSFYRLTPNLRNNSVRQRQLCAALPTLNSYSTLTTPTNVNFISWSRLSTYQRLKHFSSTSEMQAAPIFESFGCKHGVARTTSALNRRMPASPLRRFILLKHIDLSACRRRNSKYLRCSHQAQMASEPRWLGHSGSHL